MRRRKEGQVVNQSIGSIAEGKVADLVVPEKTAGYQRNVEFSNIRQLVSDTDYSSITCISKKSKSICSIKQSWLNRALSWR